LLIAIFLLISCKKQEINETKIEVVKELKVPFVKIEEIKESEIKEFINLSGDVVASNSVDIYPDVSGKIHSLIADEGDYVKKGDIVAYIDRNKPGMNFELSPVESPITGTITQVIGKIGSVSAPSVPLFKIGTIDQLEIVTNISERDLNRVKIGLNAIISTDSYPDTTFKASITKLNPVINPVTRTMKAVLKLNNNETILKPGMYVDINLTTAQKSNSVVLDKNYVISRNNENYIWKYENKRVILTPIEFGLSNKQYVEIISGIKANDFIVTEGFTNLENGLEVKVLSEEEYK
ncbi:MAG: efflux RND transporter periplasmic adaptor subunit, partial [Spirochaetales bacterium]|nr:efflux RND transporter periplasmic adaptor subunit [Spirochaetales bacterium]